MSSPRWKGLPLGLVLIGFAAAGPARADEFYYTIIWGSQSHPKHLKYTHTWATFVRAVGTGTDPNGYTLESHTISWLPATLDVRVLAPHPETGVNLDACQTLDFVLGNRERVKMWGPFRVGPELWDRSLRVREILLGGAARYRAISTEYDLLVADCIHAVAAVDPVFGREHYPLIRVGFSASRYIAREVRSRSPHSAADPTDHSWLIPRLGLDRYAFEMIPAAAVKPRIWRSRG